MNRKIVSCARVGEEEYPAHRFSGKFAPKKETHPFSVTSIWPKVSAGKKINTPIEHEEKKTWYPAWMQNALKILKKYCKPFTVRGDHC